MSKSANETWIPFAPNLVAWRKAGPLFREFANAVTALAPSASSQDRDSTLELAQRRVLRKRMRCDRSDRQTLVASIKALSDLAKLGWSIRVRRSRIEISRPQATPSVNDDSREYARRQHHGQRDEQLRQPSVREFIRGLETRRLYANQLVSIFSLMRDGTELAERLGNVKKQKKQEDRVRAAAQVVCPYLQFVREEECCPTTGLRLVDIWRYFRHTWANPYKSVPGRSMLVLVRDAAAPFHPVMGIAALSSAAVAVTVRDDWIGWTPTDVVQRMLADPSPKYGRWLQRIVEEAIDEIYKVDLFEDGLLTPSKLKRPTPDVIGKLEAEAKHQREKHFRLMQQRQYKKSAPPNGRDDEYWSEQSTLPLFRSKRTEELSRLLAVRAVLKNYFIGSPTRKSVQCLIESGEGRDAVAKIVRKAKSERVGTALADLTVCGAIPPYNELLGGKLVAMLMTSPEVGEEYRRRYSSTSSVIASSMAGRPIRRPTDLVFLGTTSLYGQRPSQYDRITIPCAVVGGPTNETVRYAYLGRTRGLGTFQFGDSTVKAFQEFLRQSNNGLQVNSVFGEGVNPRLRKIRDALRGLGLPENDLLDHGTPRLVYGVKLASNVRDYLLGLAKRPGYLFPQRKAREVSERISNWWTNRWLISRIERDDVLARIACNTLVHPISHGARVVLPAAEFEQMRLFDEE